MSVHGWRAARLYVPRIWCRADDGNLNVGERPILCRGAKSEVGKRENRKYVCKVDDAFYRELMMRKPVRRDAHWRTVTLMQCVSQARDSRRLLYA